MSLAFYFLQHTCHLQFAEATKGQRLTYRFCLTEESLRSFARQHKTIRLAEDRRYVTPLQRKIENRQKSWINDKAVNRNINIAIYSIAGKISIKSHNVIGK